ncbi:hypothetical protein SMA75_20230 [Escherichia coli]|uniref:hypothetical protein n=1 Tax=Escherichia coli TaxID=562 RepID=UPI003079B29D
MDLLFSDDWTLTEWNDFYRAVVFTAARIQESGHKGWLKHINSHHVFGHVREGHSKAVLADGYAVIFAVSPPWWNLDRLALEEMLVIRVADGPGNIRAVPRILDALAAHYKVDVVCVGDALTADDRLSRFYQRQGFVPEANQLIKEYSWAR